MTYSTPNCKIALTLAHIGIPVFPLEASGPWRKKPLTAHGHHDATVDESRIIDLWRRHPTALPGIPAGPPSDLWVLDVDGDRGHQSLNSLLAWLGLENVADLTSVVSRTPSGGLHLFFRFEPETTPRNRAGDIAPGLDTRGVSANGTSAGYFIAPGSLLPDGRTYQLLNPTELGAGGGGA
jgi:hypothetical protein